MQPSLRPIHHRTLRERIVVRLKEFIVTNKLRPGDQLPTERELAEALGVSRTAVREAIRLLEGLGVVDARPKRGAILKMPEGETVHDLLWFFLSHHDQSIGDIWEARQALELAVLPLATRWTKEEDWQEMEAAIEAMASALKRGETGLEEDRRFHAALVKATHNSVLQSIVEVISEFFRKVQEQALAGGREIREAALREHRQILSALRKGDVVRAQAIMRRHLKRPIRLGVIPAPKRTSPSAK